LTAATQWLFVPLRDHESSGSADPAHTSTLLRGEEHLIRRQQSRCFKVGYDGQQAFECRNTNLVT
jgi:hypothetical protein